MNKTQLRTTYKAKRREITTEEYSGFNAKIKSNFFKEFPSMDGKTVQSFLPIKERKEVDTWPIISQLRNSRVTITVPKADLELLTLTSYILDDHTQFEENEWGVREPVSGKEVAARKIDMVLLPLLAFDLNGYRVGYGKGFYDRFLSQCRSDALKVGLSFFPPVDQIEDVDQYDRSMDYCITPHEVFRFE
ncbi:5-formyltetrahydrofolate cyclo-ligase [Fulvivirgaceae bacterium BMA12]|uniref:5-formyltetrahydrofolate cyclo-ligase n=1 Tax=Agaribacillus aureus TaxID=3051825 RepID=A0ABT8LID2_9BACT|nr:5-formyltetrahydrofolate cyclo-ligase [Fulvivirgaceae bacterium BMA12]